METIFNALFNNNIDAILLIAPGGKIFKTNPAACKLFNMTEEEIIELGWQGLVASKNQRLSEFLKARDLEGTIKGQLSMVGKNGNMFHVDVSSNKFYMENGNVMYCIIIREKIKQKNGDEKLKQLNFKQEKIKGLDISLGDAILENSLEAKVALDSDMKLIFFNKTAENISGRNKHNVLGKKFLDVFPQYKNTSVEKYFRFALKGKIFKLESIQFINIETQQNEYFDGSFSPLRDWNSEIIGALASFQDATERVKKEQQLKESERKYRLLTERSTDMIFITDPEGKYTYASPSVKKNNWLGT